MLGLSKLRILNNNKYDEMVKMYEAGSTLAEVGAKFSMSRQGVQQILIKRGVRRRGRRSYPPKYEIPMRTCPACGKEFHPVNRVVQSCSCKCGHELLKKPMSGMMLAAYEYVQLGYGYMTAVAKAGFPASRVQGVAFRLSSKMKKYGLPAPEQVITICRTCKAEFASKRMSAREGFKFRCPKCEETSCPKSS